tara:strand:- start:197 stop:367 length:171 start_codon:yes stop_codon:yes gene_type:complete
MVSIYTLFPGEDPELIASCDDSDNKTISHMLEAQVLNVKLDPPIYSWVVYKTKKNN